MTTSDVDSIFTTIYAAHHDTVRAITRKQAGAHADDAEQDTWLRIHRDLLAGDGPDITDADATRLWVQIRANRTARDLARKEHLHASRFLPLDAAFPSYDDDDTPVEDRIPAPVASDDRGPLHYALEAAIDRLPASYRDLMRLVTYVGLSIQDAAVELGISYAAARKRMERGTDMLRDILTPMANAA